MLTKNRAYLLIGTLLIAVAVLWFATPVKSTVLGFLGLTPVFGLNEGDGLDNYTVALVTLNVLNTVFAGLGAVFTALSLRKPK